MQPDLDEAVKKIQGEHRERLFAMRQRIRIEAALLAHLRIYLGYDGRAPESERDRIASAAKALVTAVARGWPLPDELEHLRKLISDNALASKPFLEMEANALRRARRFARTLPVYAWVKQVHGLSDAGLSVIVGEAGDLSAYPRKGHLWKRMGVAVIGAGDGLDDHRQGNPGAGATKDDWIAEGYVMRRRSMLFAYVGAPLVQDMQSPYRAIYDARRAYEIARAEQCGLIVAPAAKIPAKRKDEYRSLGVIHLRAQRYMEKRLLKDLWQAWRRGGHLQHAAMAAEALRPPKT
jgi:hypothetical protein